MTPENIIICILALDYKLQFLNIAGTGLALLSLGINKRSASIRSASVCAFFAFVLFFVAYDSVFWL